MSEEGEGREGVKRVEAYSDAVIAIIVTIMVLELHAPAEHGWAALYHLWPVFTAYVLSFAYVSIYWVNHHRLFFHATRVTNGLMWSNIALMFSLSLVPFATAYLGEQIFSQQATLLYMCIMMLPSVAYMWLQRTIRRTGSQTAEAVAYHNRTLRKGAAASVAYAAGIALSFVHPALGLACAALVAIFWCLPSSPLDGLFAR
ncbi:MAG: DUF1211 domain-containing protein [Alphaproteobacteria bacterium]|nr:MAG: DUF1211 domain-containing protein [Alphaproteobacteria bacterium]